MVEWLAVWGVAKAGLFVFRPIMEDLAKDVAKDAAKSYVGKCFKSVFSAIYRDPLTKATGQALKELLELIQNELLDGDLSAEQVEGWIGDVRRFTQREEVRTAISSLFLNPDYHLDPASFAVAWQGVEGTHTLPDEFSWQRVGKRFARKVREIRQTSGELRETFDSLTTARISDDIRELRGLPPDFDLETYREALIERFGNLNFEMLDTTGAYYSGVRLWSVFVPQSVRECHEYTPQLLEMPKEHIQRLIEKGELDAEELAEAEKTQDVRRREYFSQPLRAVLDVVDNSAMKRAVILGDPGSGKSSLLRYLALRWTQIKDANLRYTQPLPLLIELRDYNRWDCPNGKGFAGYLHSAQTWHRLNQQTLDYLLKQPDRVVLLLDGLDEVFDPVQREHVVNDIHRFSNEYGNVRVIVTSRVVGYQAQRLRDAKFRHFMLQDLDERQIYSFLDKWHDVTFDKKEEAEGKLGRLQKAIKDSKSIAMLAGNPLLLTMMAILNRHQELPRDRAELYAQAARVLLQQWDTERALEDYPELKGEVDLRAKTAILRRVAQTMQTGPHGLAGNIIDGETLTGLIEDYLHDELHFEQSRAAAAALVRQLRERNFILCFLGADSYAFVHRTFLEYFCAADFVHRFHVEKTLDIDGLIELFDRHCRDDDWREVLRLICSQIDEQFVGRIVEHLLTVMDGNRVPELPLAIWCLNEVRNLSRLEEAGTKLLGEIIRVSAEADNHEFLQYTLLPACKELGPRWPGKAVLDECVFSQLRKFEEFQWGQQFWPHFVAYVQSNRDTIVELAATVEGPVKGGGVRLASVQVLAAKWPDENTRKLLEECAAKDEDGNVRDAALQALTQKWPDEKTRKLLEERAVKNENEDVRRAALQALAEKWPDEETRKLLEQRAVKDEDGAPRRAAIRALAEKWPDENTRRLLEQRAVKDQNEYTRSAALEALAERWPDEKTRKLLEERTRIDGAAASVFGGQHSNFGHIVFTKDLTRIGPYLDPTEPISREHIERAAKKVRIAPEKIDETVRSLSEHMGWDITRGSGA